MRNEPRRTRPKGTIHVTTPPPTTPDADAPPIPVPAAVLDALVGLGLRTEQGQALWAGYCLGHPSLDPQQGYQITVSDGMVRPRPPETTAAGAGQRRQA